MKAELPSIMCNTTAAKERIVEAKRGICTVKEQSQGIWATLPFSYILRRIKIKLIYSVEFWLNALPVKSGILRVYSLRDILLRWQLYAKNTVAYLANIMRLTMSLVHQMDRMHVLAHVLYWGPWAALKIQ